MTSAITKRPLAEQWAERICTQLGNSVESIIDVGRLLMKAKAELAHGEWGRLFDDKLVPFGIRSAQRLIAIAEHPTIGNTTHASYLPASWDSLYRLTTADPKRLNAAFRDGIITPDMKRSDVTALLPPPSPRVATPVEVMTRPVERIVDDLPPEEELGERFHVDAEINQVVDIIRSVAARWPDSVSLEPLIATLRFEADRLERRQERHA